MANHTTAEERAGRRSTWPIHRCLLSDPEPARVALGTTTAQRWAQMWELTRGAWAFRGEPLPDYDRAHAPIVSSKRNVPSGD